MRDQQGLGPPSLEERIVISDTFFFLEVECFWFVYLGGRRVPACFSEFFDYFLRKEYFSCLYVECQVKPGFVVRQHHFERDNVTSS